MKTLRRFLHADSLRRPDGKGNTDYADFPDKNQTPRVIPSALEESRWIQLRRGIDRPCGVYRQWAEQVERATPGM